MTHKLQIISRDLFMRTKLKAWAEARAISACSVKNWPAELAQDAVTFIDGGTMGAELEEIKHALPNQSRTVVFGSHLEVRQAHSAAELGFRTIARSELEETLAEYLEVPPIIKVNGERGLAGIVSLVVALLIMVVGYVSYHVVPFYYYYLELENQMNELIRISGSLDDKELTKRLFVHVRWMNIPAEPRDLTIDRGNGWVRMSLPYTEVFEIPWGSGYKTIRTFEFVARADARYE